MKRLAYRTFGSKSLIIVSALVVVAFLTVLMTSSYASKNSDTEVVHLGADHKTYKSVKELKINAGIVLVGRVMDSGSTVQASPVGVAADGRLLPALPQTNFTVQVEKVMRGSIDGAKKVSVALTGGKINGVLYQVEDMPWLYEKEKVVLFLNKGNNGSYYPLAGGFAVAKEDKMKPNYYNLHDNVTNKIVSGFSLESINEE